MCGRGVELSIGGGDPVRAFCRVVINAAGSSHRRRGSIEGLPKSHDSATFLAKGTISSCAESRPSRGSFTRSRAWRARGHVTLDLAGSAVRSVFPGSTPSTMAGRKPCRELLPCDTALLSGARGREPAAWLPGIRPQNHAPGSPPRIHRSRTRGTGVAGWSICMGSSPRMTAALAWQTLSSGWLRGKRDNGNGGLSPSSLLRRPLESARMARNSLRGNLSRGTLTKPPDPLTCSEAVRGSSGCYRSR